MKRYFLLLSVWLMLVIVGCDKRERKFILPVSNKSTVSGKVLTESKAGLPGVSIYMQHRKEGETDGSGEYSIPDIKTGIYRVSYCKSGYYERMLTKVPILDSEERIMDIVLISTETQREEKRGLLTF